MVRVGEDCAGGLCVDGDSEAGGLKTLWKGGRKAGLGECGLVLGATYGHSADKGLDSSMVTGIRFMIQGTSSCQTDEDLAQGRNF